MSNKALKTLTPAQFAFLKWLHEAHPELAKAAEERRASIDGFMDSLTSTFDAITKNAPDLAAEYLKSREEIAQLDLNIARAKAGQQPVTNPLAFNFTRAASSTTAGVPTWAFAAGAAVLVYLLTRR